MNKTMKYKIIKEHEGKMVIYTLYQDNTYAVVELMSDRPIEEILKDVYILTSRGNRLPATTGVPQDLEIYEVVPAPRSMAILNPLKLKGMVYDQYGNEMPAEQISWAISGTDRARVKKGEIEEDIVNVDTPYTVVATCKNLEATLQRRILAPIVPEIPQYDELKEQLEEQKALLTQQEANFNLGIVTLMQMMMTMNTPEIPEGGEGPEMPPMPPMP